MTIRLVDQAPIEIDPEDDEHREVLARTGRFGAQAAGAVMMAASTGRFLLMERSDGVLEPGTYGNCGGAHKKDEAPADAARRECGEETGWAGEADDMVVIPVLVYREPEFTYSNFVAVVPDEFDPMYGWEAVGHKWSTVDDLPSPLHFGIVAMLNDPETRALLEGAWRHHLPEDWMDRAALRPIDWAAAADIDPAAVQRPLSPETTARIARGVARFIESSDAASKAAAETLGIDPSLYPNVEVGEPWPIPTGGTSLTPPDIGDAAFTVMFSDQHPQGVILSETGSHEGGGEHEFTIVLEGDDLPDDAKTDALYAGSCDDALICFQGGELSVVFMRAAPTLREAVLSALRDLRAQGMVPTAIRLEDASVETEDEILGLLEG